MKKIIIVVLLLAAGAVGWFLNRPETALVRPAWRGKAVRAVTGNVTVLARYEIDLKSETGGRIVSSQLDEGASFSSGTMLVKIDSRELELDIQKTENDLKGTEARIEVGSSLTLDLENARESLASSERLLEHGNISESAVRRQRREIRQLERRMELEEVNNNLSIDNLKNTLARQKLRLEKTEVAAPMESVVSEIYAYPGDIIGGNAPIARLISSSRIVEARISEENFANIRAGNRASVRILGYGREQFDARVGKVLPAADPETQRYIVHLDVAIDPELLVPGLTGEVSIITAERNNAVLIPRRALVGNKVLVVSAGRVEVRSVETGYDSLNEVEILGGIEDGELVITEQLDLFREGDRVRVTE